MNYLWFGDSLTGGQIAVNVRLGEFMVWQPKRTWHGTSVSEAVTRCSWLAVCPTVGKRACLTPTVPGSTSAAPTTPSATCTDSGPSATVTNVGPVSTTIGSTSAVRSENNVDISQPNGWDHTLLIRRRGNIKNNWMTIFPLLLHYFRLLSRSESCNFKFGKFSLLTLTLIVVRKLCYLQWPMLCCLVSICTPVWAVGFFLILLMCGFYFYEHKKGCSTMQKIAIEIVIEIGMEQTRLFQCNRFSGTPL